MDQLPDEILIKIFQNLNKRDLSKCSQVSKRWNRLSYSDYLWLQFSLTDIVKPKWCASKLVSIENTNYLIEKCFSSRITRVDLAKLCFSFETLDLLFQHCNQIKTLVINFKYLQIKAPNKYLVDQCIHSWPINKLEALYLKNVCDMKTRRFNSHHLQQQTSYDIIELEIIKLIRILFRRNSASLRVLGLKCVDPNIISSCVNDFGNLDILLLNNINDTDSILTEIAYVCKNLKCLEITKCREFKGDGLQDIVEHCPNIETLQLGKQIFPTLTELNEIDWQNFKYQLRELSITTKFHDQTSMSSSTSSSTSSLQSILSPSKASSSNSIDLYSQTLFNYLKNSNKLEYLALEDFTLKFPSEDLNHDPQEPRTKRTKKDNLVSNLKHLYLRNIRNIKQITNYQTTSLKSFIQFQYHLSTLDLIGLYLSSSFICSILTNLNNLKVFNFGHGKSYRRSASSLIYIRRQVHSHEDDWSHSVDIDSINQCISLNCPNLTQLGIFYRQSELKFKRDSQIEYLNDSLIDLFKSCTNMRQISYLKSFKVQDEDEEEDEDTQTDFKRKIKNYYHYIRYAIQNATEKSNHVDMKPCYGYDLTPSSGFLLDSNGGFIETSLPLIKPPFNDFHNNLLKNNC